MRRQREMKRWKNREIYNRERQTDRRAERQYSQTCVQRPPLGPEKRGRYAEVYMKKISGK